MDAMRTFADLKRELERRPRGAQGRLADALDIDPSQLSRQLKAAGKLTVDMARDAAAALERMDGAPQEMDDGPRPQQGRVASASRTRLPVYGYAAASDNDRFVLNDGQILEERELPMGMALGPGDYFIVLPAGSSMEPRIVAGEAQVVRWNYPAARDKTAVVEFRDGTAVIKNFKGWRDGRLWVEQFNPPKMLDFDKDDIKAVHAVIFSF